MKYRASRSPLSYLGGLLALYLAIPIVAFLYRFAQPGDRGFGSPGLWSALWTSVATATVSMTIVALLGIPLAYWLARSRGRLTWLIGLFVQLPLALPPVMSGLLLIYIVGPYTWLGNLFNDDLTGTVVGVVIAQTFVAGPFLIVAARTAFEGVDPALEDLAASLGRRPASRFWLVSLRGAMPGIRTGMLMTWLRAIGEYGATVLLAYHPYTLPVFTYVQFSSTGIPGTQAPTALALAVAVAVLLISQLRLAPRLRRPLVLPPPARRPPSSRSRSPSTWTSSSAPSGCGWRTSRRATRSPSSGRPARASRSRSAPWPGSSVIRPAPSSSTARRSAGSGSRARRVGYVPQGHIMFPGRTVWQQVLFGAGADPALAAWWLRTLRLDGLEGRLPGELSGGQRQRVALARALSFRPRLVLLDEPFSALDAPVREELRRELRRLQRDAGLSTVIVTHDAEEAALLADEILVVDEGRLLQAGPRAEVFARPASPQVARLLGIPNLIHATVTEPGSIAVGATQNLRIAAATGDLTAGAEVLWTIRPDHVTVLPGPAADADGNGHRAAYPAVVDDIADIGTLTTVTVRLRTGESRAPELRVRTTAALDLAPGDHCAVRLDPADITAWPADQVGAAERAGSFAALENAAPARAPRGASASPLAAADP